MASVTSEFYKWDAEKQKVILKALRKQIPLSMQLEKYSFLNNDKPMMINMAKTYLL